jgi:hypothetical protein
MGKGTRWNGTAGDHKGPPSRSPPPSPLRTNEHGSTKPTLEMSSTAPAFHPLSLQFRSFGDKNHAGAVVLKGS